MVLAARAATAGLTAVRLFAAAAPPKPVAAAAADAAVGESPDGPRPAKA